MAVWNTPLRHGYMHCDCVGIVVSLVAASRAITLFHVDLVNSGMFADVYVCRRSAATGRAEKRATVVGMGTPYRFIRLDGNMGNYLAFASGPCIFNTLCTDLR